MLPEAQPLGELAKDHPAEGKKPSVTYPLAVLALVVLLGAACSSSSPKATVISTTRDLSPPATANEPGERKDNPDGLAMPVLSAEDLKAGSSLSTFSKCDSEFECAHLSVRSLWSDLGSASIELEVTRRKATGTRVGALFVNPGGPGNEGVSFIHSFIQRLPEGLAERFDIVSWNPRGTAGDNIIDCSTAEDFLELGLDPTPDDDRELQALRDQAAEDLAGCIGREGSLLAQVGTHDTVFDMEALRLRLGGEPLNYLGYSYGTTIGLDFLRTYPGSVRAMVLDGVSMPGVPPLDDSLFGAQSFERTLDSYLADCPNRLTCPFTGDPKTQLIELRDRVSEKPIGADYTYGQGDLERDGKLGEIELIYAVAASLYDKGDWTYLDEAIGHALGDDANKGYQLLSLRDEYLGLQEDGSWSTEVNARGAIRCADQKDRSSEPEGDRTLEEKFAAYPFFGKVFGTGLPGCWGFPKSHYPLVQFKREQATDVPGVVVIGTTNDPATGYEASVEASEALPGSVLVTFEGEQHTVYRRVTNCIDAPVTKYLIDLTMPAAGIRC